MKNLENLTPKLLEKLKLMTALVKIKYGNLDDKIWKEIQETEQLIEKAENNK